MDKQNIDNVNKYLSGITETVARLRTSVASICTELDYLDDTIEAIEIKVDIIGAYMVEEERKEKIRNTSPSEDKRIVIITEKAHQALAAYCKEGELCTSSRGRIYGNGHCPLCGYASPYDQLLANDGPCKYCAVTAYNNAWYSVNPVETEKRRERFAAEHNWITISNKEI